MRPGPRSVRWLLAEHGWRRSDPWMTSFVDLDPAHRGGLLGLAPSRSGSLRRECPRLSVACSALRRWNAGRVARRRARTCPCGLAPPYPDCCGRLHRGETSAATAELLMRSRYSAFAVGDAAYLLATWHPSVRPSRLALDPELRWTGLEVVDVTGGGQLDAGGTVSFRARAVRSGRVELLEETSRFVRDGGAWRYAGPVTRPGDAATGAP